LAQAKSTPVTIAMKSEPTPSTRQELAGLVERVTFHNAENGFCVLRIKARGHRDVVTVVGHAATIAAGEWITASGEWVNDRTHGQQFKARFLRTSPPTSADGIVKYLSSGMIQSSSRLLTTAEMPNWTAGLMVDGRAVLPLNPPLHAQSPMRSAARTQTRSNGGAMPAGLHQDTESAW
jgi:hypothetical protein